MKPNKSEKVSDAQKLRDKLAKMNKQRVDFDSKTKELESHMELGFGNLEKIGKGIKSHSLDPELLSTGDDPSLPILGSKSAPSPNAKRKSVASANASFSKDAPMFDGMRIVESYVMPPGLRVSDWCFIGSLDSAPPVVKLKSNDIYENIRLLGRGSFGDVYLVKNKEDNRMFANKTIFCEKEKYMEETLVEVQFMRKNRHPCIIDIHDGFITANPRILNIVMSYCEAGDLGKVISAARKSRTNISEAQIIKWSMQIALALHFLHENGSIHRDLKPVNVMLTEGGDLVKVADFGLAMDVTSGRSQTFHEAGTPYYTAPEMIQGQAYSYPVDCFSFGVMLHELMRLDLPFQGSSTADLVRSILQDEPPALPAQYSEDLKNISLLLMAKDPSKRLGQAGLLAHPLFNSKMLQFPAVFKPKSLEERIRRVFIRQLNMQVDGISNSKRSSTESCTKLWEDHKEAIASKVRLEEEKKAAEEQATRDALLAQTSKAASRAVSKKQVKLLDEDLDDADEVHSHDDNEEDNVDAFHELPDDPVNERMDIDGLLPPILQKLDFEDETLTEKESVKLPNINS